MKSCYFSAIQAIATQIIGDKFGDVRTKPIAEWRVLFLKNWDAKKDFSFGLLHAERFTLIATYVAIAKVLVKQAHRAKNSEHAKDRRDLAERFVARFEPIVFGWLGEIEATRGSRFTKNLVKKA